MSDPQQQTSDGGGGTKELHEAALSELSQLGRVSHRLAMTDGGAPLEKVLTLLLPRLLSRVGTNHARTAELARQTAGADGADASLRQTYDKIHAKLVEMLSHTMKRVRADGSCRLPCGAVLGLLYDAQGRRALSPADVDPFTLNLSLAFLTLGMPRCDVPEVESLLPGLLSLVGTHCTVPALLSPARKMQANQCAHLVLRAVESIATAGRGRPTASTSAPYSASSSSAPLPSASLAGRKVELPPSGDAAGRDRDDRIAATRDAVRRDAAAGSAVYDLFLDVLLYQPAAPGGSTLPPPGLSQAGHERLLSGSSGTAAGGKWGAEFASRNRLRDLKLCLLEFVAPCRRWALFQGTVTAPDAEADAKSDADNDNEAAAAAGGEAGAGGEASGGSRAAAAIGTARTVALLAVTAGDPHPDVADRAASYLKAHMDSLRNVSRDDPSALLGGGATSSSSDGNAGASSPSFETTALLGDPIALAVELLTLVLGDTVAEGVVAEATGGSGGAGVTSTGPTPLGAGAPGQVDGVPPADLRAAVVSTKRRMVGGTAAAAVLGFVSGRILDDVPRILAFPAAAAGADAAATADRPSRDPALSACVVGSLSLAAVGSFLGPGRASAGADGGQGGPRVEAARLLNSLTVRLASLYDALVGTLPPSDGGADGPSHPAGRVHGLLARSLALSCSVLSSSSSPHTATSGSKGGIDTKDSCYGVICTLARSSVATAPGGMIFNCGGQAASGASVAGGSASASASAGSAAVVVSIATAALLFGCASNEEEALRPRSVAALDALLGAYCRVYDKNRLASAEAETMEIDEPANPWGQPNLPDEEKKQVSTPSSIPTVDFASLSRSLLPLLWSAAQNSQPKASRLAAARWASDLVKPLDLANACHILCFLAGDPDVTASSAAKEGLALGSSKGEEEVADISSSSKDGSLPDFQDIVSVLFPTTDISTNTGGSSSSWRPMYYDFSPRGQAAALRFGLMCLLNDLYGGEDSAVAAYLTALTSSLAEFSSESSGRGASRGREAIDLLDECSLCFAGCLATSKFARSMIVQHSSFNHEALASLALTANSSKARRRLAEACGHLYEDTTIWSLPNAGSNIDFGFWAEACGIATTLSLCASKLEDMQTNLFMAGEVHGAAFLGSHSARAFRLLAARVTVETDSDSELVSKCWGATAGIIRALGQGTCHSDEAIGNACSRGIAITYSYDGLDSPLLERGLYPGTANALTELNTALRRYGNGDNTDATRASSLARAVGFALAASTSGAGSSDTSGSNTTVVGLGHARLQCVDSLFALLGSGSFRKDAEISLVVGEALARYADAYSPEGAVWTSPSKQMPKEFDEGYAIDLPPHKHVVYVLLQKEIKATNPHKRTACAPAMLALVGHAARMVNNNVAMSTRAFVTEILDNLVEFQTAFITLLGDPKCKQLCRESCCLGLAACQGLAVAASSNSIATSSNDKESLNERLLRAFGTTTKYGGSAMMESAAQNAERRRQENRDGDGGVGSAAAMMEDFGMEADTINEVGGASGVGEAALGAYREMAAAAMSLGRSDVLYSLMLLSVTHAAWFAPGFRDRYNANSLLGKSGTGGTNTAEIQLALRPHLGSLLPRLLRACNDPRKETREQMTALLVGLTGGGAEARAAISEHLLPTIDSLMDDATNKLWRARVGACGALSEVIVGRSWQDLGGGDAVIDDEDISLGIVQGKSTAAVRLLRLWRVTTRALDDVRLTVRESGESLGRSVRALTIRLCDPSTVESSGDEIFQGTSAAKSCGKDAEASAAAAAATALRWLVKYGLNQPCAEATGFCVSSLLGVVEVARPSTLRPVLPELIGSLAMAMSGLEPAALNYLQVRASGNDTNTSRATGVSGYDRLERLRLQISQSGPIAGALTKCLDMVRFIDIQQQKQVIPHIDSALRCGAGFATRAAAADAVTTLCSTCPSAFKIAGHSSTNPTVRLLRALYFASERERGAAARDKMAHALGSLAELAPGHSVRVLALRACERYSNSTGASDDPAARRAAASALRAIAVRASGQFADGGSNDIWCKRVLPLAFLGRKDEDAKVAALWAEVWEEGGSVANVSGSRDFGVLLEEKLLPSLVHACIVALNDVAWSRRVTACAALIDLADINVLAPAPRPLQNQDNSSPSKESLLRARRRSQASAEVLTTCARLIVKSRIWTGKAKLVEATVKVAGKWAFLGAVSKDSDWFVFGWDASKGIDQLCPWMPIVQQLNDWNSLFRDDAWFESRQGNDAEDSAVLAEQEEGVSQKKDENEVEEDSDLDFSEGDKVLEEAEAPSASSENVHEELLRFETISFSGLCRVLLEQGLLSNARLQSADRDENLPYRAAALQGLSDFLQSSHSAENNKYGLHGTSHEQYIYSKLAPRLLAQIAGIEPEGSVVGSTPKHQPPLIVARSLGCLSSVIWNGLGEPREDGKDLQSFEDVAALTKLFCESCGGKQPAWTVREAAALAGAALADRAASASLRRHETITTLLECTVQTSKDRKFWRVRYAGLKLLHALVRRAGTSSDTSLRARSRHRTDHDAERQLMLEAMLTQKEKILQLARGSLSDNEAKVTAVATEICGAVAWWP